MGIKIAIKDLILGIIVTVLTFYGLKLCFFEESIPVMMPVGGKVIVLDAGHGGFDPGKVGTNGEDEKNINLIILDKLQNFLEQAGATVVVTRATDEALGDTKNEDMSNRKEIINGSDADILVSIHQNSYTSSNVKGAQVFYHEGSEEGKRLAELIQWNLKEYADSENKRIEKENSDYYILKTTNIPAVLVECGFLSNADEEMLLNDSIYQEKIAWGIYVGIIDFFENDVDDEV